MIVTGKDELYTHGEYKNWDDFYHKHLNHYMTKRTQRNINPTDIADKPILEAEVNVGRWLVRCPFCAGAEMIWEDSLIFMCESCWNKKVDYKFLKVKLPLKRTQIEKLLELRPNTINKNWLPNDTIKAIEAENLAHGIVTPIETDETIKGVI